MYYKNHVNLNNFHLYTEAKNVFVNYVSKNMQKNIHAQ